MKQELAATAGLFCIAYVVLKLPSMGENGLAAAIGLFLLVSYGLNRLDKRRRG